MSYASTGSTLDQYWSGFGFGDADAVYEGNTYNPVEGTPFIATRLSAYTRSPIGFGSDCWYQESGTYQITIYRPASEGRGIAADIADQVVAYWPRGMTLEAPSGQGITIEVATAMPAQPSGAWMQIIVMVQWISAST